MYLLIELFSSLMSRLGRESVPTVPAADRTGGYHIAADATLS